MNTYTVEDALTQARETVRAAFLRRTYIHVAGGFGAFALVEAWLLQLPGAPAFAQAMTDGWMWLAVLGVFMVVGVAAEALARSGASPAVQYLGFGMAITAWAVVFMPMMLIAQAIAPEAISAAGLVTAALVLGLTAAAARKDFSFLRTGIIIGWFIAAGLIVASILFGFGLGLLFGAAMIVYAAAVILYQTSEVMRTYPHDQHVAAALALFASIALAFWYILRMGVMLMADD